MKKKKDKRNDFLGFDVNSEIQLEFADSDDRTTALIGAIGIEILLERLLKAYLVDDPDEVDSLISSNKTNAPLSSFYSKIQTAYCLGLLSKKEFQDIQKIRELRNIFAHHLYDCSFEQTEIKNICKSFWAVKLNSQENETARSNFIITVYLSEIAIKQRIDNIERLVSPENVFLKND